MECQEPISKRPAILVSTVFSTKKKKKKDKPTPWSSHTLWELSFEICAFGGVVVGKRGGKKKNKNKASRREEGNYTLYPLILGSLMWASRSWTFHCCCTCEWFWYFEWAEIDCNPRDLVGTGIKKRITCAWNFT